MESTYPGNVAFFRTDDESWTKEDIAWLNELMGYPQTGYNADYRQTYVYNMGAEHGGELNTWSSQAPNHKPKRFKKVNYTKLRESQPAKVVTFKIKDYL